MTLRLKPEVRNYPEEHKGHDDVTVYPLWRNPFGMNQFSRNAAADADVASPAWCCCWLA